MNSCLRVILCCLVVFVSQAGAGVADVENVKVEKTGENTFSFQVTLSHGDEGWDHYADSWEIFDEKGTLLATRILHHPHVNEQPFTRGLTGVHIPGDVSRVTVRGHDNIHGYGGSTFEVELP